MIANQKCIICDEVQHYEYLDSMLEHIKNHLDKFEFDSWNKILNLVFTTEPDTEKYRHEYDPEYEEYGRDLEYEPVDPEAQEIENEKWDSDLEEY